MRVGESGHEQSSQVLMLPSGQFIEALYDASFIHLPFLGRLPEKCSYGTETTRKTNKRVEPADAFMGASTEEHAHHFPVTNSLLARISNVQKCQLYLNPKRFCSSA
jgi:hypothetical protein